MFLALRELRRRAGRFTFLSAAVGLLVFVLLFFQAVSAGLLGSLTGAIDRQSAPVLVLGDLARGAVDGSVIPPEAQAAVAAVDGVAAVAPVGQAAFTARIAGAEGDVALFGVTFTGPGRLRGPVEGRLPAADDEVLASALGAEDGFALGDEVMLEPAGTVRRVVGRIDGASLNALPTLYGTIDGFEAAVLARSPGAPAVPASLLAIEPDAGEDAATVAARITDAVPGVAAATREAAVAALPGVEEIGQSFGLLYGLLLVVVCLVIGVFFLILTVQKRDALLLLRAVGARRRDVVQPLVAQVVVVVGAGVALAVLLAVPTVAVVGGNLGAALDPGTVALTAAGVVLLGLVAAAATVRRLLAIDPVEATSAGGLG